MVMMYFSDSVIKQFKRFEHNSVKEGTFWNHERKICIQITMHLASFIFLRSNTGPCQLAQSCFSRRTGDQINCICPFLHSSNKTV
jgi:hypothetical protein